MNVMIDTNIILDDVLNRAPNAFAARRISQLIVDKRINGYITANSITDIFYIVSKNMGEIAARKTIKNLLMVFGVISVNGQDCKYALDLPMTDFEDALVVVCSEKASLDYIVTNDKCFLNAGDLNVLPISPVVFISKFEDS